MGAQAWTTRVAAGVAAVLVIGGGAALALPVLTGSGDPAVSVDDVPDTDHAGLVEEQEAAARKEAEQAAKERQAELEKAAQQAEQEKAEEEARAKQEAETKAQAEAEEAARAAKAAEEQAAKDKAATSTKDTSTSKDTKESTVSKDKESTDTKESTDKPATPAWWPEHVWAHATSCTVADDGQSVVGTWDVWIKYGGDWTFVSASDDPDEVSGTDGDKTKIVYSDRTATLYKEHDGKAKFRGGPVQVTVANAADSAETHTFTVDLWVVASDDGTCPA